VSLRLFLQKKKNLLFLKKRSKKLLFPLRWLPGNRPADMVFGNRRPADLTDMRADAALLQRPVHGRTCRRHRHGRPGHTQDRAGQEQNSGHLKRLPSKFVV
jgi:hypothetical protein